MFDISPNFDEQPSIHQSAAIEQHFYVMIECLPDKAWEETEKNKNYDVWFQELKNQGDCHG